MVKYADLLKGMQYITPTSYKRANPNWSIPQFNVRQDEPIYYAGTKLIRFIGQVQSDNIPNKKGHEKFYIRPSYYNVEIDFKGVERETGLKPEEIKFGHLPRPSLSQNDIMVRCTCENNRFRVDWANRRVKAAAGTRPPVYHRKWPVSVIPHLNDDTPMICKHAVDYIKWLLKFNYIVE